MAALKLQMPTQEKQSTTKHYGARDGSNFLEVQMPKKPSKSPYPGAATTYRASTIVYLDPPKMKALNQLSKDTRIPKAALLREAVDDLLRKYKVKK